MRTLFRITILAAALALNAGLLEGLALPFLPVFLLDLAVLVDTAVFLIRRDRDMLQPLSLILVVFALRVGLPAAMLMAGAVPVAGVQRNWADPRFWQAGFYLCMAGCSALGVAYLLTPTGVVGTARRALTVRATPASVWRTAQVVMILGGVLWLAYMAANFGGVRGIATALTGGMVRGMRFHTEGTSRYGFIARQFLLWGAVMWGVHRYEATRRVRAAIVPALVAFVVLITNGGRIAAISAPVLVLLVVWYLKGRRAGVGRVSFARIALWAVGAAAALVLFVAGGLLVKGYRGGGGLQMATRLASFRAVTTELQFSAWYETGFLHPFAFAIREGGGSYHPPLARYLFSGYTAYFAGVRDVLKPGQLIIQQDLGITSWGIHTGAFVDLYMGFGVLGAVAGAALLGVVLKLFYARFAQRARGSVELVVYAFTFWHVFWVLFESVVGVVSGWFENSIVLFLLLGVAALLRSPQAPRRALPPPRPRPRLAPAPGGTP